MSSAMLIGCGGSGFPKTYKVSGTVKLGGKPVDGALVTFMPSGSEKSAVGAALLLRGPWAEAQCHSL